MTIVIDSSAIIALGLTDEDAAYAESVLDQLAIDTAVVPMLFWYEIRNVMLSAERKQRIAKTDADAFLNEFNQLSIQIDTSPIEASVMSLARRHNLTSYDASYLELAMRFSATLATLDQRLKLAAIAESVPVLPDPWLLARQPSPLATTVNILNITGFATSNWELS